MAFVKKAWWILKALTKAAEKKFNIKLDKDMKVK